MSYNIMDDVERVLVPREEIIATVKRLGAEITRDYAGKEPILVSILTGAFVFMADIAREIKLPCTTEFMSVSSYHGGTKTSGEVKIIKDLSTNIEGKDVIIIEDIFDSGITLSKLLVILGERRPASLKVCSLFSKPKHQVDLELDYVGITVPNEFIVGYGLDYAEKYRNLPDVCVLKREVYER